MSRNVYFGNDFYKFLLCIRYDFFDIFLSIKAAITLTVWFHVTVCKYFAFLGRLVSLYLYQSEYIR